MRRGRPEKTSEHHSSAKPSPSPLRFVSNDPFAALDQPTAAGSADELASRFPTLDQFSILHEKGSAFNFEQGSANNRHLSEKVTNALADEAFALPKAPPKPTTLKPAPSISRVELEKRRSVETRSEPPEAQAPIAQPVPLKAGMVSTGTMTSPSPSPSISDRPIHRFPPPDAFKRPSSQPRTFDKVPNREDTFFSKRASLINRSQPDLDMTPKSPASSRPSLEGRRPSLTDLETLHRSKSASSKARPTSAYINKVRDSIHRQETLETFPHPTSNEARTQSPVAATDDEIVVDTTNISSDMDFLRAKEDESAGRKRDKRHSSGSRHVKRASLPSISLSGTKNLLAGRFGEAFRKFESNAPDQRSQSPSPERGRLMVERNLSPITGSEATERSDDGHAFDETEEVSPEVRRELERRRLSQEEKRVADAAAEYRRRLVEKGDAGGGGRGPQGSAKAAAIQNRVQSLLHNENGKPVLKTAEGYGRFTADVSVRPERQAESETSSGQNDRFRTNQAGLRKVAPDGQQDRIASQAVNKTPQSAGPLPIRQPPSSIPPQQIHSPPTQQPSAQPPPRLPQRPLAPTKPQNLRSTGTGPGAASFPPPSTDPAQSDAGTLSPMSPEDWEANFSKKYPSLNKLEMVEMEIDRPAKS